MYVYSYFHIICSYFHRLVLFVSLGRTWFSSASLPEGIYQVKHAKGAARQMYLQAPLLVLLSAKTSVCLSVCCAQVCVHTDSLWFLNKALKNLQGSYLHAAAPHFFIKSCGGAAEAPLHHNVTKPHKGKHMRPGRNLQIWPERWIFFARLYFTSLNAN